VNAKLDAIAEEAAGQLRVLFAEASDDIERGIEDAVEDAQATETEAKFNLSFSIQLNLDRNTVTHRLGFSTRHKFESVGTMADPNQTEMFPKGGTNE
jgi:hypothetical protein